MRQHIIVSISTSFFLTFVKDTLPLACNRSYNEFKVSSQIIKQPLGPW